MQSHGRTWLQGRRGDSDFGAARCWRGALPGTPENQEQWCASPLAEGWQRDRRTPGESWGARAAEEGRLVWTSAEGAAGMCLAALSVTCLGDIPVHKVRGHCRCGTCLQGQGRAGRRLGPGRAGHGGRGGGPRRPVVREGRAGRAGTH